MAVTTKKKPSSTKSNTNNGGDKEKVAYKYANAGSNFWQTKETLLKFSLRKSEKYMDLVIKIHNLDEDNKLVKTEDDKYDNGFFTLSPFEILKLKYLVERMIEGDEEIEGAIINHISQENNTGSQLEIIREEDGFYIGILMVENAQVKEDASWWHKLDNDQKINFYNADGEADEMIMNMDLLGVLSVLESAYGMISGLGEALIECCGGVRKESKSGGLLENRSRPTVGSKKNSSENESDENDDQEEEEEIIAKKTTKKKPLTSKNMKKLLSEDDDE